MIEPSKDWLAMVMSAIGGAFTAIVGMFAWFGRKLNAMETRIAKLENAHSAQVEQHKANLQRMERQEDELINIDNKLDRQTEVILQALAKR